ncbi:hypothetical protein HK105_200944 [Polyrhizophydium stewartii]|uniref:RNI-like protein n=1 Tax=Polyrhizophydium stewartii TaxID=2732419 RepID=A0ABR4NIH2_9FUNG
MPICRPSAPPTALAIDRAAAPLDPPPLLVVVDDDAQSDLPPAYTSADPLAPLPDIIAQKPWNSDAVSYIGEQLSVDQMCTVLEHVGRNASVKKLYLAGNNVALTDEVMPILARSMRTNTTLTYLNLASCSLSTKGAAILGIILRSNVTLDTLLVQDNSLCEDGAAAFAKTLAGPSRTAQNATLRTLNISGNAIMDSGFAALSHALIKSLVGLRELYLVSNSLTDNSAMLLGHLVASHPALEMLFLQGNNFSNATVLAIDKVINPSLSLVSFLYNKKITLRSNSIVNKKRIWWKPKHETRYSQNAQLPLIRSPSWGGI